MGNSQWTQSERDSVHKIYGVYLPRVMYGSPLWVNFCNKNKLRSLDEKTENLDAIYKLGKFRSTPLS